MIGKAKRKPTRHPAAIAWEEWYESAEGKRCRESYDFTRAGHFQYLENRLIRAFQAGYAAAERLRKPIKAKP